MNDLISPIDLGAPAKFSIWREGQLESVLKGVESPKRFIAHAAPTGTGKSLLSIGHALMADARVAYITSSKALQTQLLNDFGEIGLVDVRGAGSFQCIAAPDFDIGETIMCDMGPCHSGLHCPLRTNGCLYYDCIARAKLARMVVTNYKMWMSVYAYGEGLGKFDLLVLDEAHAAEAETSDFLTVVIDEHDVSYILRVALPDYTNIEDWKSWAKSHNNKLVQRIEDKIEVHKQSRANGQKVEAKSYRDLRLMKDLQRSLQALVSARGKWIIEWIVFNKRVSFVPLTPASYSENTLFLSTPKVLLLSATIRPKTLDMLGIRDYDFFEAPSTFPPETRPVIYVPTIGLNYRSTEDDLQYWLSRIDEIIGMRLDRKGIIHAVSYKLGKYIIQNSQYRKIMMTHDTKTTRSTIEQFKQMKAPAVLVSPSITTGVDFAEENINYAIIGKIPYPDMKSIVLKERIALDSEYMDYYVAQTITQMCGRIHRSISDRTEVLVTDDNWIRFMRYKRSLFPDWFLAACKTSKYVPMPPKLRG